MIGWGREGRAALRGESHGVSLPGVQTHPAGERARHGGCESTAPTGGRRGWEVWKRALGGRGSASQGKFVSFWALPPLLIIFCRIWSE